MLAGIWWEEKEDQEDSKWCECENQWFESINWVLDTMNMTLFPYFTDIWRYTVIGDQSKGENDIYLGLATWSFSFSL